MIFDDFCATVRAEFPDVHFLFDEPAPAPFVASAGRIAIVYFRNERTWSAELHREQIASGETIQAVAKALRGRAFDTLNDARYLGILPLNYAVALDVFDAVVKEDVAAMTPEERDAAISKLKTEIRRRLDALKERNQ